MEEDKWTNCWGKSDDVDDGLNKFNGKLALDREEAP
jgi:hypothetical protein